MSLSNWKRGAVMISAIVGTACSGPSEALLDKESVRRDARMSEPMTVAAGQHLTEGREGKTKGGFVQNIETMTETNQDFRRVIYTAQHLQLVLMTIPAGENIGAETHDVDQFFRVESGTGEVIIGSARSPIGPGSAMIVPARTRHDVAAQGKAPLKLYTLYAPPKHRDRVVHRTRADAERDTETFDGQTTE